MSSVTWYLVCKQVTTGYFTSFFLFFRFGITISTYYTYNTYGEKKPSIDPLNSHSSLKQHVVTMSTHQHFHPVKKNCFSDFIEDTSQTDRQPGRQKPVSQ